MTDYSRESGSLTGLTDQEAQEFHALFMKGFFIFTMIAIVAHILVWAWRPWLPGPDGYTFLDQFSTQIVVVAQATSALTIIGG
jgi:light-harvesting complex 1 beta chain